MPFVYHKISPDVAILIVTSAREDAQDASYSMSLQTYNIKKGKMIDQVGILTANFGGMQGVICDADVDNKGIIKLTTMSVVARVERFEIRNKGKIKELN